MIILLNGGVVPLLKKLLAVLITTLLIFSSLVNVFATETDTTTNTNTITENEPDEEENQEPVTITVGVITEPGTNKTGVVLRSNAGTTANKVYLLNDGTSVTVLGSKDDINNKINDTTQKIYVWYNITYTFEGVTYTGYVREDLIKVTTYVITPPNEEEEEIPAAPTTEELLTEIKNNIEYVYPYDYSGVLAKRTASSTEATRQKREYFGTMKPKFLNEKFSGADRGTAVHKFLELCDFNNAIKDLEQEKENLHCRKA